MTSFRRFSTFALFSLLAIAPPLSVASAQPTPTPPAPAPTPTPAPPDKPAEPPPTPEQLEQAKQAFIAGKTLFDEKKFEEAADKFKESYRLSKNPLLLYNVAFTFDQWGQKEMATFYYKKFMTDAPADAAQRPEAEKRLKQIEKDQAKATPPDTAGGGGGGGGGGTGDGGKVKPPPRDPASLTAADFEHQVVDEAPPGKPLDLTAFVPEGADWNVTLFYRGPGEAKFTAVAMKPRYNELVGRVPAKMMNGVSIQYYLEVRTPEAKIVTRIGKPSSPNIVYIDAKARPRYYPDLTDERDWQADNVDVDNSGGGGGGGGGKVVDEPEIPGGYFTPGSTRFNRGKWVATGSTVAMVGLSVTFYLLASNMSDTLEAEAGDANDADECGGDALPCRRFNGDRQAIETAGKRNELVSRISLGVGLATVGLAAWYWYKDLKAEKKAKGGQASTGMNSIIAAPVVGEDYIGGAAALRF